MAWFVCQINTYDLNNIGVYVETNIIHIGKKQEHYHHFDLPKMVWIIINTSVFIG